MQQPVGAGASTEVDPVCSSLAGFEGNAACRRAEGAAAVSAAISDGKPGTSITSSSSGQSKHEITFALTAQLPGCSAAGRRTITASVNKNIVALPGVFRSATRVVCNKRAPKAARYNVLSSYVGTGEAKAWIDASLARISPCCLWRLPPLCSAFYNATGGADAISDASFCTLAAANHCSPPPPPPSACEDYLPFVTGGNLVVWGEWTTNPSGAGSCIRDPIHVTFWPTNGPCAPLTTSLLITDRGMLLTNCSVRDVPGEGSPVVGPGVELVVQQGVTSMTIKAILLANVAQQVSDDCSDVLRFSVITSLGTTSMELPCTPSELDPYSLAEPGALVPAGERVVLRFTGLSSRHVLSLRRLYYRDSFVAWMVWG